MTEPFATPHDHAALLKAIRDRLTQMNTTLEWLESRAGLQSGYATKILGKCPIRRASPYTIFLMLEAVGLEIRLHERPDFNPGKTDLRKAKRPMRIGGTHPVRFELGPDFFKNLSRKAAQARAIKISPEKRSALARCAAKARWRNRQQPGGKLGC